MVDKGIILVKHFYLNQQGNEPKTNLRYTIKQPKESDTTVKSNYLEN